MAASMLMKMACVVVACMVVLAPHAEAAITCGTVVSNMISCLTYLQTGVLVLKDLTVLLATALTGSSPVAVLRVPTSPTPGSTQQMLPPASLPSKCGVNIPYKISPNSDCSKYVFIIKNTHKYLTHSKRSLIHHWSERNRKGNY
ncbi:putative plant lipid transfer protein/Par allergen [Helianthus annuus]|uniref:Plant lipid transfer protein/Par allergen n=1 Tax=Helianthus annuus TaxID=4232 RepID=A0A251U5H9_HELAN|nr:putative plant lipid transfer protein/Par allergen [Helianthus annuus]KAJ0718542.1 putative plant non-specific lipid-transfer protein/Par allergen [Helianthus annuus]KAJ0721785.1 putative plant non-specific lipid-transfer protein/Par allergen [Helianthus annuus]